MMNALFTSFNRKARFICAAFFLALPLGLARADELTCKYTGAMTPADPRLAKHNRYHPGIKIPCVDGPTINIANEKLAKRFEDEMNGHTKPKMEPRLSGIISATVKKHGADLLEVTAYKWVGPYENPNLMLHSHKRKKTAKGGQANENE